MAEYYVYILTNRFRTAPYTGVTNNLTRRVHEHKSRLGGGFAARYHLDRLVYYESTGDVLSAIAREKQIKGWLRERKVRLIESANPRWLDLAEGWFD